MNKQPPSGGCVLKLLVNQATKRKLLQPPSGGCVLKRQKALGLRIAPNGSRLRAAVC